MVTLVYKASKVLPGKRVIPAWMVRLAILGYTVKRETSVAKARLDTRDPKETAVTRVYKETQAVPETREFRVRPVWPVLRVIKVSRARKVTRGTLVL
jgi:hypothetical protein